MALSTPTQRSLLFTFILSLCACGLLGIYVLLLGTFSWLEVRVLGTTAAVGAASILAMASAVAWEGQRWRPLGLVGVIAVSLALLSTLGLIWDIGGPLPGDDYEKATASLCVLGVALPHMSLLSLARLHRGYEWVRLATVACIAALTGELLIVIWATPHGDLWARMMGVLAILVVCGTLAVPVLHRVSGIRRREETVTTTLAVSLTCPRCGRLQQLSTGRSRCACGLRFLIEIEEEHCPKCGYALYKLESNLCPECGASVAAPPP